MYNNLRGCNDENARRCLGIEFDDNYKINYLFCMFIIYFIFYIFSLKKNIKDI